MIGTEEGGRSLQQLGLGEWNVDYATVMSYQDDFDWNLRAWDPGTPMILDVLALQYVYGKNMATNAGDNTYTLGRSDFYQTYWDAGGVDTLTASTQSEGWLVMLPNQTLSSLVDTKIGLASPLADLSYVAPTSLIWFAGDYENAVGSNFNDALIGSDSANYLIGNAGNDLLRGMAGNDVLDGGLGTDVASFSGYRSQYSVNRSGTSATVVGPDGTDLLTSIERLLFTDVGAAFDLEGNAGLTVKLLGAVFGAGAVRNKAFVAIGLSYFDSGWTYAQVADLAIDAALGSGRTNAALFDLLYFNTIGDHATQSLTDYWVSQLQSGAMTQAQLATFAADMQINLDNINFVGLRASGLEYSL